MVDSKVDVAFRKLVSYLFLAAGLLLFACYEIDFVISPAIERAEKAEKEAREMKIRLNERRQLYKRLDCR